MKEESIETDVLVIGAGMAGCRAAIAASDNGAKTVIATKGLFGRDGAATWMAFKAFQCWGIQPGDTLDRQVEDTLKCGWFLGNQENVYAFLAHVPDAARELFQWGVRFKTDNGRLSTIWQLGQSVPGGRSLIAEQWPRGEMAYNFIKVFPKVIKEKKIQVVEDTFVTDLLVGDGAVVGALGIDMRRGQFIVFKAKTTILATGGYQSAYKFTTANHTLTGDGQGMALRAGVDVMDFEFNQTLPSAIWPPSLVGDMLPFVLITECDGHMYNSENERFLSKWNPEKMEHSTRAVLSRAIFHEIKSGRTSPHGGIYTSVAHQPKSYLEEKFSEYEGGRIFARFEKTGMNLFKDSIETGYAMHYCQGGCSVDTKCRTDKPGLYAIGEAASGGKDGADRMMANSLPYCMAMGAISGREAAEKAMTLPIPRLDNAKVRRLQARALAPLERQGSLRVYAVRPALQEVMTRETLYGRTEEGLIKALDEVERSKKEILPRLGVANKQTRFNMEWINTLEFENTLLVCECIIRNALARQESRGLHDRWDYPAPGATWSKNIHLRLVGGELQQWAVPVEFAYFKPASGSLGEPWHQATPVNSYRGWKAEPLWKQLR